MKKFNIIMILLIVVMAISSCAKKLDLLPVNDNSSEVVYKNVAGYKSVLAKIYGTLSITGNSGPAGNPDIGGGLDEGSQVAFIRGLFNLQELPTDEAVVAWNDQTIKDFHNFTWNAQDPFIYGIYARCIYNISLTNEFIRECDPAKLAARGITGADANFIATARNEARFIRAYNYWAMIDLFGKSTFITEADGVGAFRPKEISRPALFNYIESELRALENDLPAIKSAEYGRVDKGAAIALLARLYLNAQVYTGNARWTDAATYADKIITATGGYSLYNNYPQMFFADNDKAKNEFIFVATCDGLRTQAYGNTTFLVNCACGPDNAYYGTTGGWFGYRATAGLANLFPDLSGATDKRALFTTPNFGTTPAQIAIPDVGDFSNGLHVAKFRNIRSDGGAVSDPSKLFSDIDFPLIRLAEMHLIYAEAVLRGSTYGNITTAINYFNAIRARAFGNNSGNVTTLTLQNVLDERGRELYWEGHRRTDLVRYGLLTTGLYLWPWKGGSPGGNAVDAKYNIYPIPATARISNPNLTQNNGY